ncbi:hypothetical protein HYQ46_011664 [Verticillium longisporum]|nr:hypothetical protein HYQ46_011664 [Verticillium longisporum]
MPKASRMANLTGMRAARTEYGHFDADQSVLYGGRKVVGGIALNAVRDSTQPHQNGQQKPLPIRREDDELDAEELRHRAERQQILVHADPKQTQCEGPKYRREEGHGSWAIGG